MKEVSNRSLAILLVFAILISIGGTLTSLNKLASMGYKSKGDFTGFAINTNENASVSLTVAAITAINFTTETIDWGSGAVDPGFDYCNITSQGANGSSVTGDYALAGNHCDIDSFNVVTGGLILENIGNKNVTLNMSCGKTAATFLGGTGPLYMWNVSTLGVESTSCMNLAQDSGMWRNAPGYQHCANNLSAGGIGQLVCNETGGGFSSEDDHDTLRFDFYLAIPSDATSGTKTDTFYAIVETI